MLLIVDESKLVVAALVVSSGFEEVH